ncbi:Arm DNA-binding domain-containing protein [Fluviibacterium sp. MJW13]|uniref:Arm DNA-binding domain-containing protein n=1 Tax=Meridianimarinicoccus sp. MJW13 TaxID=2720031 RepID=UPI0018696555
MHFFGASGSKSWRFKDRIDGKVQLLAIGDYPAVSVAKARAARADLLSGMRPSQARQEARRTGLELQSRTFAALADGFLIKVAKAGRAAATAQTLGEQR